MSISQKPPKDQDFYYAPNTSYSKKNWVHIPYVRYSRRSTLLQHLAMGSSAILFPALILATLILNSLGIDYSPADCPLPEPTLRGLTALCGILSPAAMAWLFWLDHHATAHTWTCIFSRAEVEFYISKGKRLYRSRREQENQKVGLVIRYVMGCLFAALALAIAVFNLMGRSFSVPDILL